MATISSKILLICLTLSLSQFGVVVNYIDGMKVLKVGYDIIVDITENLDLIRPRNPEEHYYLPFIHNMERKITQHISKVSQKIDTFQQQMDVHLDAIVAQLLNDLPLQEKLDEKLRMLDQLVGQINDLYNIFEMYSKESRGYEKYTLEDFASTCVSSRSGAVPELLRRIHRLFVPQSHSVTSRSILVLLANQMQNTNMWRTKCLIYLLFLSVISTAKCVSFGASKVDEMRNKLLQLEEKLENDLFDARMPMFQANENDKYLWLINSFKNFCDELEYNFPTDGMEYLINSLSPSSLWNQTEEGCRALNWHYSGFNPMLQHSTRDKGNVDIQFLVNIAKRLMDKSDINFIHDFKHLGDLIVHEKLFISAYQDSSSQICNEHQSPQQLLYNLYTMVTLAEIKGYVIIQFSYKLLRLYNPGSNFTEEMEMMKQQYATRTLETLRAVKTAMAFAPKEVWRCDPKVPKLDETYTKFTQLFQGYIVNEVDLNRDGTCRENCGYYEYTKVYGCFKNKFCAQQRKCNGRVLKCDYIDSDMWICPALNDSDRRYKYIQYENGRIFGNLNVCNTTKVDSWWRWLFWHCSYCFCYCDDNTVNSDRYFSLRAAVSDVENNKVVTGVRFKKANQIIHIQIQEGELMPGGTIKKQFNVQWKPIEEFSVLDSNVKNGIDYHTLSWEKRGLDLDDLVLDTNYVLTGLRFRMVGPRLNLEAKMCKFNFTTGRLMNPLEKGFWLSHDQTNRDELVLTNPDIPTTSPFLALPDSTKDQYLNFAPSSREHDAAQNTIPFIDIQPVEPNPPVPLAGAGIFHKGRAGSGGYVALRLITYDFSQHLTVNLSPNTEAVLNNPIMAKVV